MDLQINGELKNNKNLNINSFINIKKVEGQNYLIDGTSFNANFLISNLLDADDKKENNLFENNVSMEPKF